VVPLTAVTRLLRLDREGWERSAAAGSAGGAFALVIGAYALLAFDRFGMQAFTAPRASFRLVLIGLYSWICLTGSAWLLARIILEVKVRFGLLLTLYGYAHLPLLVIGLVIQVLSVGIRVQGPALILAVGSMVNGCRGCL